MRVGHKSKKLIAAFNIYIFRNGGDEVVVPWHFLANLVYGKTHGTTKQNLIKLISRTRAQLERKNPGQLFFIHSRKQDGWRFSV